ncbi:protein kinase family protein [Burkholderiales bacterium JOSHI_001]|nr:protein kinase family protein [Burkholderiales bacterium JOSHI_001]
MTTTAPAAPAPQAPPARPAAQPTPVPARIGAYPVSAVIGTGSMGVVYLGHDPVIDRPVAIKTLRRHLLDDGSATEGVAQRFRVEARAAGRLNHRGIVSVYQFAEDEAFAYIVMEYVRGHSLAHYLRKTERLPRQDVLCLMVQLLEALHYAHEAGVVHRDIKPANLMVDTDGWLKITDFGIARTMEASSATKTNALVGTPGYMAPELYVGGAFDRRVDIFSAGVLLYQMLAGHKPFSGTMESIMYEIVYKQHVPLSQRTGDLSLDLFEPVLDRALAKDPGMRFANAQEFIRALKALASSPLPAHLAPQDLLPFQPPWEGENALATLAPRAASAAAVAAALVAGPAAEDAGAEAAAPADDSAKPSDFADTASLEPAPGTGHGTHGTHGSDSRPPTATEPVPTGWDPSALVGLEQELAQLVGPMAKVLVRRAARGQVHLDGVRQAAAAALVDATVRQRFLAGPAGKPRSAAAPAERGTIPPGTLPSGSGGGTGSGALMTAQDVDKATAVLKQAIGPIAAVLVKRCADTSQSRERFITRVMEQLVDRVDSAALQAELLRKLG